MQKMRHCASVCYHAPIETFQLKTRYKEGHCTNEPLSSSYINIRAAIDVCRVIIAIRTKSYVL